MENSQNKLQNESAGSTKRNKKLVILVILLALVAVASLVLALAFGLRTSLLTERIVELNKEAVVADSVVVADELPAETVNNGPCGDYPFTSQRKVTSDDLWGKTDRELCIMRNEIYARHGYIFDNAEMRNYFEGEPWYTPSTKNVTLSEIERYNVNFIKNEEKGTEILLWEGGDMSYGDYPFTSLAPLSEEDLCGMSKWELSIMRNEIYARHGYIFDNAEIRSYFEGKEWYTPITKNVALHEIEKYNVDLIKRYEQSLGGN